MIETTDFQRTESLKAGNFRKTEARLLAFYLPQFHPIPENDQWWGKGFTEWTNTAKAKPLFRGHHQPNVPADLGFYDLRVPEVRAAQAEMAKEHGIEAFCYWHYWFAGDRLIERPFNEVLRSGEPDFPFCLGWANASWTGIWYGAAGRILKEQTYPGLGDHEAHFYTLLEAFSDPRYMTVDGKPVFLLFRPMDLPDSVQVTDFWRQLAAKVGLKGLHLIGVSNDVNWIPQEHGFDAATLTPFASVFDRPVKRLEAKVRRHMVENPVTAPFHNKFWKRPVNVYDYADVMRHLIVKDPLNYEHYPCVMPNWDNTPRSGIRGSVLRNSTPELFRVHLKEALEQVRPLPAEHQILVVKSWNEWAEGNYLEPDLKYGRAYLKVVRDEVLVPPQVSRGQ